mmetsp:Transcript_92740/g.113584  ORF Transcript_92740/g.113584 Transcript_92740/m.113584 type:complete len:484 (+) Transcript_92740:165-1616(+)
MISSKSYVFAAKNENLCKQWLILLQKHIYGTKILENYLHKRGEKRKKWLLRYFILYETLKLIYFENDTKIVLKGCIQLNDVTKVIKGNKSKHNRDHVLELHTNKRVWLLACYTSEMQTIWFDKLNILLGFADVDLDREISWGSNNNEDIKEFLDNDMTIDFDQDIYDEYPPPPLPDLSSTNNNSKVFNMNDLSKFGIIMDDSIKPIKQTKLMNSVSQIESDIMAKTKQKNNFNISKYKYQTLNNLDAKATKTRFDMEWESYQIKLECLVHGYYKKYSNISQNILFPYGITKISAKYLGEPQIDSRIMHKETKGRLGFILGTLLKSHKNIWSFKFNLLYRGSRDGMNPNAFHKKCDGIVHTITIVKSNTQYVFGGYTRIPWSSSNGHYKHDATSFLFNIKKMNVKKSLDVPQVYPLRKNEIPYAVFHYPLFGPVFGRGWDLSIFCNGDIRNSSASQTSYAFKSINLCGEYTYFAASNVEVYQLN